MKSLYNKYEGQTVSIVGKGQSLQYLKPDHFVTGPVITLNESVLMVESLNLSNPIYSMQKDSGPYVKTENDDHGKFNPTCKYAPNCGDRCGGKTRPSYATLMLDVNESGCCFPDYPCRILFNTGELGLRWNLSTFFCALRMGAHFGCNKYRIICCDSIAGIDIEEAYRDQYKVAQVFLPIIDHEFITPGQEISGVNDMRKVSIIIPVVRPESAIRCREAINERAGIKPDRYEIVMQKDRDGIGCPAMVKQLTASTLYDLVMFLGDDTVPQKNFLLHALRAMESLPDGWGVVGLNTNGPMIGFNGTDIPKNTNPIAHWMADKRMLKHIPGGDFFSTDYKHCWCDNELKDIADELGRWMFAPHSKIDHRHPVNNSAEWDDILDKAYSEENKKHDLKTYRRRKIERTRANVGTRLALSYPVTYEILYTPFVFSNLHIVTNFMVESFRENGRMPGIDILTPLSPGNHDVVRNDLVNQALNIGCTHILMMDTDQVYYDPNTIRKLLDHDKMVVGARVHRRYPPYDPIFLEKDEDGHHKHMKHEDIERIVKNGETINVPATGCGCIMYDTRVFLDIDPPWFVHKSLPHGRSQGEDMYFCEQLKRSGHEIFVDASIKITHLSLMEVGMDTYRVHRKLNEIREVKKNG